MLDQLARTARQQQTQAMQGEAAADTASLMARYGMRMMLGGSSPGSGGGLFSGLGGGLFGSGGLGSVRGFTPPR
jgi:hypothetical protein